MDNTLKQILFEQISDQQGRRYRKSYNQARQYQNTLRRQKRNPRGRDTRIIIYPKTGRNAGKNTSLKRKTSCRQTRGFLNRYNFAHPGRDVVNQAGKVTPKLINQATGEINKIAQQRIDQVIRSGGAETERVAPKIIKGAIEEVYKTPFRLLGNLGKKQFQKIKRKLFK